MSNVGSEEKSFASIELDDLKKLLEIAQRDRELFFGTHPKWSRLYATRVVGIALCQGAAKHFIDGTTGINDFDVYTFYKRHPRKNWYAKRIKSYDLGTPKFGQSSDRLDFVGRRVDCLGRDIDVLESEDSEGAIVRYLSQGKTKSAKLLREKAVVLLEPNLGKVIWPRS